MKKRPEPIVLGNEVEASLMGMILREQGIPHFIKTYHDRAYDGVFQFQMGWGRIDAPVEYQSGIRAILTVLRNNRTFPTFE
jgi:outer membrane protein assembly factor BamE (lipoprotein component of BamABCDE complex)